MARIAPLCVVLAALAAFLLVRSTPRAPVVARTVVAPSAAPAVAECVQEPSAPVAERAALPTEPALQAPIELHVASVTSFARDAAPVAGVAFQVLALRASVAAPEGSRPIASLIPPVALAPDDPPLFEGRTAANGEARVTLAGAAIGIDERGEPRVAVRVVEPGHQQQVFLGRRATPGTGPVEVKLMPVRGATARGRVVDAAGNGVPAEVEIRKWIQPQGVRKLFHDTRARQLADGWFELHLREPIAATVLIADAGSAGTGSLADVTIALDAPPQDLRVVVRGEGALRGRVLDGAGNPAPGVELLVLLAELDDAEGSFVMPEPAYSFRLAEGGGSVWRTLKTDAAGAFAVRGLRPGQYVVRARTGQGYQSGYARLLTPAPVLADGAELELKLARPHLLVRLLDTAGLPMSGTAKTPRDTWGYRGRKEEWPEVPVVLAYRSDGELALGEPLQHKDSLPGGLTDGLVFEVPSGAHYVVGAMGGGFDGSLQAVELPSGVERAVVELRARPEEFGVLAVTVETSEAPDRTRRGFEVRLESPASGHLLLALGAAQKERPFVFRVPSGNYRVVAQGAPEVSFQHGTLWGQRWFGRDEVDVDVQPGATREVALVLEVGARIEVSVTGSADEADADAVRALASWFRAPDNADDVLRRAAQAELELRVPGRSPETVPFSAHTMQGTSAEGTHLIEQWPLDETHVSEALPAGRFTLVGRLPGGREARAEVELRAGATTKVALRF